MSSLPIRRLPAMFALSLVRPLAITFTPATATPALARSDAPAGAATAPTAVPADLTAAIRLSNCSATLVRYPTSRSTDRAMMLTNGHCFEGGFLAPGQVI